MEEGTILQKIEKTKNKQTELYTEEISKMNKLLMESFQPKSKLRRSNNFFLHDS